MDGLGLVVMTGLDLNPNYIHNQTTGSSGAFQAFEPMPWMLFMAIEDQKRWNHLPVWGGHFARRSTSGSKTIDIHNFVTAICDHRIQLTGSPKHREQHTRC